MEYYGFSTWFHEVLWCLHQCFNVVFLSFHRFLWDVDWTLTCSSMKFTSIVLLLYATFTRSWRIVAIEPAGSSARCSNSRCRWKVLLVLFFFLFLFSLALSMKASQEEGNGSWSLGSKILQCSYSASGYSRLAVALTQPKASPFFSFSVPLSRSEVVVLYTCSMELHRRSAIKTTKRFEVRSPPGELKTGGRGVFLDVLTKSMEGHRTLRNIT